MRTHEYLGLTNSQTANLDRERSERPEGGVTAVAHQSYSLRSSSLRFSAEGVDENPRVPGFDKFANREFGLRVLRAARRVRNSSCASILLPPSSPAFPLKKYRCPCAGFVRV